jgi:hypothetical protein
MSVIAWSCTALSTVIVRLDRAIQYSRDGEVKSRGRGVLDAPHSRGMTKVLGALLEVHIPRFRRGYAFAEAAHQAYLSNAS